MQVFYRLPLSIILAIITSGAFACDGTESTKKDALSELVEIIYINHLAIDSSKSLLQQATDRNGLHLTELQEKSIQQRMLLVMRNRLHAPGGVFDKAVEIYDQEFTAEEVCESLRFFKSSAGAKYINHVDEMSKALVAAMSASFAEDKLLKDIDSELLAAFQEQGIQLKR